MSNMSEIASIKAAIAELTQRVNAVEASALTIEVAAAKIELKPGEAYAGLLLGDDGKPLHHLILLPGEAQDISWDGAMAWAAKQGGELPSRREQSLLFANLKGQFAEAWYWSSTQHAVYPTTAWVQYFGYGYQCSSLKSYEGRARAVRRLPI